MSTLGMKFSNRKRPPAFSEEHRRNLSIKMIGNSRTLGKKISEEHKKKISESNKGKNPHAWTEESKKKLSISLTGKTRPEEVCKKIGDAHRGERSHLWKGGRTSLNKLIRSTSKYKEWRITIFERDLFTCVFCGDDKGGNLEADHIAPLSTLISMYQIVSIEQALSCEVLWDISNGRTLCDPCHQKTPTFGNRKGIPTEMKLGIA